MHTGMYKTVYLVPDSLGGVAGHKTTHNLGNSKHGKGPAIVSVLQPHGRYYLSQDTNAAFFITVLVPRSKTEVCLLQL